MAPRASFWLQHWHHFWDIQAVPPHITQCIPIASGFDILDKDFARCCLHLYFTHHPPSSECIGQRDVQQCSTLDSDFTWPHRPPVRIPLFCLVPLPPNTGKCFQWRFGWALIHGNPHVGQYYITWCQVTCARLLDKWYSTPRLRKTFSNCSL